LYQNGNSQFKTKFGRPVCGQRVSTGGSSESVHPPDEGERYWKSFDTDGIHVGDFGRNNNHFNVASPGQKRAVVIDLPSQDHEMLQGK